MRRVSELRHRWLAFGVVALAGMLLSGCETFRGKPSRLYTVDEEVTNARASLPDIAGKYYSATSDNDRIFYRNEYIARRMYIIDAEFTEFEVALTREREEFGFSTALVTQGLTTAGAVFTPANTVRTLSALAGGVNASRGFYDSELLVSKTIQIIEAQMETRRDEIIANIIPKMGYSANTYPLSAALLDLEDLYRAGTLTSGLIRASADAGEAAKAASADKMAAMVVQGGAFQPNEQTTKLVLNYFKGPNRTKRLTNMSTCLFQAGFKTAAGTAPDPMNYAVGTNNIPARNKMIACAQKNGDPM